MFHLTRRTTTLTLIAASSLAPAVMADAASAGHHHGGHQHGGQGHPPPTYVAAEQPQTMALLLPAVQAARESAR